MKHLSLVRFLSICLALISMSMLISGFYGLNSAEKDRKKGQREWGVLSENTDEYREILVRLANTEPYSEQNRKMTELRERYEKDSAKHRADLATFTATRAGLKSGREMLDEAEKRLVEGKTAYETGLRTFEMQAFALEDAYDQALEGKAVLDLAMPMLNTAKAAVTQLNQLAAALQNLGDIMDLSSDDSEDSAEAMRLAALVAFDTAISLYQSAVTVTESLQSLEIPIDLLIQAVQSAGIEMPQVIVDLLASGEKQNIVLLPSEELELFRSALESVIGMSMEEFLDQMESERDAILMGDGSFEYELTSDQFETLRIAYTDNRAALQRIAMTYSVYLPELEAAIDKASDQLLAAYEAINQLEAAWLAMEQGRAALAAAGMQIQSGEQQLNEGKAQLGEEQKKLDQQAEELEREKQNLDRLEEELKILNASCESQKELEDREIALRLSFLSHEEIRAARDAGEEILSAAESLTDSMAIAIKQEYNRRFPANLIMILGALCAFLTIPVLFKEEQKRAVLLILTMLCLSSALTVILLFEQVGRGLSYSAAATGGLALLTFLSALPIKKPV